MDEMIAHELPSDYNGEKIIILPTRFNSDTGRFQIRVNGKWRQSKEYDYFCFDCCYESGIGVFEYLKSDYDPLEYYGYKDAAGTWIFWGVCVSCRRRITDFFWKGKKRQQKPTGGNGHGWLRKRRQLSRY
uniref:Uncharacterized protein n=1 Tax=viral metagenome TaxID=1070528 RepID=A0A6M3M414_9ZZZZ